MTLQIFEQFDQLCLNNNNVGAMSLLEVVLSEQPSNEIQMKCLDKLIHLSYSLGQYNQCIKYCHKYLKLFTSSENGRIYCEIGNCYFSLQSYNYAYDYYTRALTNYPCAISRLIETMLLLNKQDDALEFLHNYESTALGLSIEDRILYYSAQGQVYEAIQNPTQAFACYMSAFEACSLDFETVLSNFFKSCDVEFKYTLPWQPPVAITSHIPLTNEFSFPLFQIIFVRLAKMYKNHFHIALACCLLSNDHFSTSQLLFDHKDYKSALFFAHKSPISNDLHFHLGLIQQALCNYNEAIEHFNTCPSTLPILFHSGQCQKALKQYSVAQDLFKACLQIDSTHSAFQELLHVNSIICDWKNLQENINKLHSLLKQFPSFIIEPSQVFTYHLSDKEMNQIYFNLSNLAIQQAPGIQIKMPPHHSIIRVGYVSSDIRDHSLAHLTEYVFSFHSSKFQSYVYSLSKNDSSHYRTTIKESVTHFYDCESLNTLDIAQLVEKDQIDILIDLNGYTPNRRTDLFAMRCAPIQMHYMGYPGPMNAPFYDYLIADRLVSPPILTEKVVYMPHSYFVTSYKHQYSYTIDRDALRKELFPNLHDKFILGNFNQLYKITPTTWASWMRILEQRSDSILWLLKYPEEGSEQLINYTKLNFPHLLNRIVYSDLANKQKHMERIGCMDLYIDCIECNGHTTACDALWNGVPMVTLQGTKMHTKVATSIAYASGYGMDMVVDTLEGYEQKIIDYSISDCIALRDKLLESRNNSPLFNTELWVKHFEKGLKSAYDLFLKKQSPQHIYIRDF